MRAFLDETIQKIQSKHSDFSNAVIILPSKRAGGFLKHYLRQQATSTYFAPTIISIEEFIQELANLTIASSEETLMECYKAYQQLELNEDQESFDSFSNWATTLINDFNEIDRYLVDPKAFFSYLSSIKNLEKWGVPQEQTPLIKGYLKFWNQLHQLYNILNENLLRTNKGSQGMVYRKAVGDIEYYLRTKTDRPHYFIGFNALNKAEEHIFQALLEQGNTEVHWDIDSHFYYDEEHSASVFIRRYLNEWKWYRNSEKPVFDNNYLKDKSIKIIEAQNSIQQAKHVGSLLTEMPEDQIKETAIVLADESLLVPVLYSLPSSIKQVNITMGAPLVQFNSYQFFEGLFQLHSRKGNYYFKAVVSLLQHPFARVILNNPDKVIGKIHSDNLSYLSATRLVSLAGEEDSETMSILFSNWQQNSEIAISNCLALIEKGKGQELPSEAENIALQKLEKLFQKLALLISGSDFMTNLKSLYSMFTQLIRQESLDFEGDAYEGLQIMGVLETRVLDFKHVIFLSVNEGILPSGKSNASFITSDLKKEFDLPFYTDKDSIYAYHFYRLLQRAETITLLYNGQSRGLESGEKSRFIMQLQIENTPQHNVTFENLTTVVRPSKNILRSVNKTELVLERIKEIASKGFSPSALTSYIRNPLEFYYQKVLKIRESDDLEETVEFSTLGTVVHNSLENLYKDFIGKNLTREMLQKVKPLISSEVESQFREHYKEGALDKGKNLIIYEVAKRYVSNLVDHDIRELKNNTILLLHLEADLSTEVEIPHLDFPVKIGGMVDRIDLYNDTVRILDYKTGKVEQRDMEIIDWKDIGEDYKYSKAFQVLTYATLCKQELKMNNMEAGIISFKNLSNGFLRFAKKNAPRDRNKQTEISEEVLIAFKEELVNLISEICDPQIPFVEKPV